jgi:hypothetical protein
MITKEEARKIALNYLAERKREYEEVSPVDKIRFIEKEEVLYGPRSGEIISTYSINYLVDWGLDYESLFIRIDAETGEPLYTMGPTSVIEQFEDN